MNDKPLGNHYQCSSIIRKCIIVISYFFLFAICLQIPSYLEKIFDKKVLNVCTFTETFCPEGIARFEKLMNVKVNITYVELDEQIYAKFKINNGNGYDIINVSDFMVQMLADQKLLYELDHTKITNKKFINDHLLNKAYDKHNIYALPHKWFIYGLVYNKDFFKHSPDEMTFDLIFKDPKTLYQQSLISEPYKICMIDSPLDAFFLALLYHSYDIHNITNDNYKNICNLLTKQKKWIESYTLYTIEYFLFSNIVPIALTSSNFMRKIWDEDKRFDFAVPKEGGILVIENLVIAKHSKQPDLAHAFINFMLSNEIAELNSSEYKWSSANKNANAILNKKYKSLKHLFLNADIVQRLHIPLFSPSVKKKINDCWLQVGFA